MHFFAENARVVREAEALERDDLDAFFQEIIASGRSSYMYLQNVYANQADQSLSIALCMAEGLLAGKGRVAHPWRRLRGDDAELRPAEGAWPTLWT